MGPLSLMKILVACEFSNTVSRLFREKRHTVWSCDLVDNEENNAYHYKGDVREIMDNGWDMLIGFPPCTHLAVSGSRWFHTKTLEQAEALDFVRLLLDAPIEKICIENPVGIISTQIRPATQYIQPHEFGFPASKKTGLWLKGLPNLRPTHVLAKPPRGSAQAKAWDFVNQMSPSAGRAQDRSRTFFGIAQAMADQWG